MVADARHICPAIHEHARDWLNQFWHLADWPADEKLGEQVFGLIALTEASVRLSVLLLGFATTSGSDLQLSSVCVSACSAQMGLIETTRGLLPGAGKIKNRGVVEIITWQIAECLSWERRQP